MKFFYHLNILSFEVFSPATDIESLLINQVVVFLLHDLVVGEITLTYIKLNSNMTSFFRFVNKRVIYRLGIISLTNAPVHVTDFPVINVHANELRTSEHCFGLVKPSYYQSEWTSWVKKSFWCILYKRCWREELRQIKKCPMTNTLSFLILAKMKWNIQ